MKRTIHPFTKLAGLKSDQEFYKKFKTPEEFFEQYPEAANGIELPGTSALSYQNQIPTDVQYGFNQMKSDTNLVNDPIAQQQMKPNSNLPGVTPDTISPYRPEPQPVANKKRDFNVKFSNKLNPDRGFNIPDALALGIQGVNGLLPYQQLINQNQPLYNQAIQSNPYGTNSFSTFAKGGMLQGSDLQVEENQFKYISPDTIELGGKTHEQGGTDIAYNGTPVEAELGETIHLDDQGNAIVGGNLQVPNTNIKYKTAFKKVAKQEEKNDKIKDKSAFLLNNFSPDYKYSAATFNTGSVLSDAYEQNKQATGALKQDLTDMQNLQLELMDRGMKPKQATNTVSKYGKKIKADKEFRFDQQPLPSNEELYVPYVTGDMYGNLPESTITADRPKRKQEIIDPLAISEPHLMGEHLNEMPIINPNFTTNAPEQQNVPYVQGMKNPMQIRNRPITDPIKGLRNKFNPLNYLGEVATILDKPEPVPSTQIRSILEPEYNISLQAKKNAIISAYKPAMNAVSNNPAQQAAIAGQMAEQLANVDSEEVNYNQQNTGAIRARNLQELRNVRDTNTKLTEDQQNKQIQTKSITQDNRFRAIESISDKEAKRKYLNNQLGLEEQLAGWRFNPKNVEQQWQMIHPNEPFPGWKVAQMQMDEEEKKSKRKTTIDSKGKRTDTYETDTKETSYFGGKIAERKSSGTKPKGKLKYC